VPKRIVIAGNGHGTRIGIGPVCSDEAARGVQKPRPRTLSR
jgi:hypothetical protein